MQLWDSNVFKTNLILLDFYESAASDQVTWSLLCCLVT